MPHDAYEIADIEKTSKVLLTEEEDEKQKIESKYELNEDSTTNIKPVIVGNFEVKKPVIKSKEERS